MEIRYVVYKKMSKKNLQRIKEFSHSLNFSPCVHDDLLIDNYFIEAFKNEKLIGFIGGHTSIDLKVLRGEMDRIIKKKLGACRT